MPSSKIIDGSKRDKPTFDLTELQRAQKDFLQKGQQAADSPREMSHGTNTMNSTAAFLHGGGAAARLHDSSRNNKKVLVSGKANHNGGNHNSTQ